MRIGFVGLGNMGGPMALNLIKAGHSLIVHDVRREAAAPHLPRCTRRSARWPRSGIATAPARASSWTCACSIPR